MRIKLFTFRYSATLGGFDESPLQEFVRNKEVVAYREHFYAVNEVPHMTCVPTWQDAVLSDRDLETAREVLGSAPSPARTPNPNGRSRRKEKRDPTEGLSEPDRVLYNTLREWRRVTSRQEGVASYIILTNRELLEVVARKPDSPTALGHIPGIGAGKIERYGEAILKLLAGSETKPAEEPEPAAEAAP